MNGAGAEGNRKVVCVTGASGYIASWLVKLLLHRGYTVNATVRDPDDLSRTGHLLALEGAMERLHLFKANLMEEGSFDSAISGCEGVFHTASPVILENVKDPQADVLDPAIKGTLNVLSSCNKFPSVRRVILTSSVAAVTHNDRIRGPEVMVDESWFSNPESCKESKSWYHLSKTLAEEAAWKFAKENNIDMVSINPGRVIGPLLQPTVNASVAALLELVNGAKTYPNIALSWVHVKDIATAHIAALEVPSANGRYCVIETVAHFSDIVKILRELYPAVALPDKCEDDKPFAPTYQVSKEKVKSLGIDYIPLKVSLSETFESLKKKGFVSF